MTNRTTSPARGTALVLLTPTKDARQRSLALARKADDRIPDDVWLQIQECGEKAAFHLHRLLNDANFERRKIHEQIRVIELAMLRSYGAPEGSFKRVPTPPEGELERAGTNALSRLARRAKFPELQSSRVPETTEPKDE